MQQGLLKTLSTQILAYQLETKLGKCNTVNETLEVYKFLTLRQSQARLIFTQM